jgi:hypothetical protein
MWLNEYHAGFIVGGPDMAPPDVRSVPGNP